MPFRPLRPGGIVAIEGFRASDFDVGRPRRAYEVPSAVRIGSGRDARSQVSLQFFSLLPWHLFGSAVARAVAHEGGDCPRGVREVLAARERSGFAITLAPLSGRTCSGWMRFRPPRPGGIVATEGFKASDSDVGRPRRAYEVSPYNFFLYSAGTCLGAPVWGHSFLSGPGFAISLAPLGVPCIILAS